MLTLRTYLVPVRIQLTPDVSLDIAKQALHQSQSGSMRHVHEVAMPATRQTPAWPLVSPSGSANCPYTPRPNIWGMSCTCRTV